MSRSLHASHRILCKTGLRRGWSALVLAAILAGCSDHSQPMAVAGSTAKISQDVVTQPVVPILAEPLTPLRHAFTDGIGMQVRVKPAGRPTDVVNLEDASRVTMIKFTVQPGVRFPWHSHPGLVIVSVTQGELVFVYADDCVPRPYRVGEAFVDPGFGNVHYAYNPTGGETVILATFIGVPPSGPLTIPVDATEAMNLDAKCNVPAATAHSH